MPVKPGGSLEETLNKERKRLQQKEAVLEAVRESFRGKENSLDKSSLLYAAKPDQSSSDVDLGELDMRALMCKDN